MPIVGLAVKRNPVLAVLLSSIGIIYAGIRCTNAASAMISLYARSPPICGEGIKSSISYIECKLFFSVHRPMNTNAFLSP